MNICRGLDGSCKVLKVSPVEGNGLSIRHARREVEAQAALRNGSSTAYDRMSANSFGHARATICERATNSERVVLFVAGDGRVVSNDETV